MKKIILIIGLALVFISCGKVKEDLIKEEIEKLQIESKKKQPKKNILPYLEKKNSQIISYQDFLSQTDKDTLELVDEVNYSTIRGFVLKDKNNVYLWQENKEINKGNLKTYNKIDAKSFELIDNNFCYYYRDKDYVYYYGSISMEPVFNNLLKSDIDPETFELINTGYVKDKNAVYYFGRYITDDIENFKYLGNRYARDKDNFYIFGNNIKNFDNPIKNFQFDEKTFAYGGDETGSYFQNKDKIYQLFFLGQMKITDPTEKERIKKLITEGYEYLGENYFKANFKDEKSLFYKNEKEDKAHYIYYYRSDDFKVYKHGYARDSNKIFKDGKRLEDNFFKDEYEFFKGGFLKNEYYVFRHHGNSLEKEKPYMTNFGLLTDIYPNIWDVTTFESLSELYVKDKYFVYICEEECQIIPAANPENFEIFSREKNGHHPWASLPPFEFDYRHEGNMYAKDKNHVYKYEKIIPKTDPKTFTALNYGYGKDKNNAFYKGEIIKNSDPETFITIEQGVQYQRIYAKDKNQVYYAGQIIPESDPNSISILSDGFIQDDHNIFLRTKKIKNSDSETFEILCLDDYQRDKNNAYFNGEIIKGADTETFEMVSQCIKYDTAYAKDKNLVYRAGDIIPNADPVTFKIIDWQYSKDKNHVYENGKIREGENPETFQS